MEAVAATEALVEVVEEESVVGRVNGGEVNGDAADAEGG